MVNTSRRNAAFAILCCCVLGAFSANATLTVASILLLAVIFKLLWRPGEPPVLVFAMGYHWIQASIMIFYADGLGVELDALDYSGISIGGKPVDFSLEPATWLTLAGVLAITLGLRIGIRGSRDLQARGAAVDIAANLSIERLFVGCLLATALAGIVGTASGLLPPLRVPLLALANVHWVFVYLLAYTVLSQRRGYRELGLILAIELVMGFFSYFSEFKTVLVVVLIAALAAPGGLRGSRWKVSVAVIVVAVALGLVWTAIKTEYRAYISDGSGAQTISVSTGAQFDEVVRLVGNLTPEQMEKSADMLINRLSYVYFFAEVLRTVPDLVPYEDGALWGEAVLRAFVPRLIDSSKAIIDDSARTAEYTRLTILGGDSNTSVSLGYVAESYIDFGPALMMVALLVWGVILGGLYRKLTTNVPAPLFGYACATVFVFLNASVLEQSNAKMVGGVVVGFLVFYILQKWFAVRLLLLFSSRVRSA